MAQAMPLLLCKTTDIAEGAARGFELAQVNLLLLRDRGQFYLFHNRCPHMGVPLEWEPDRFLDNEGSYIRCSTHGALFLKDSGECIVGPCRGEHLRALPFEFSGDEIRVSPATLAGLR